MSWRSCRVGARVRVNRRRSVWEGLRLYGVLLALSLAAEEDVVEVPAEVLHDKIRGGLLGQILGDLNGLKHEMKHIQEPGNVTGYVPALPEGAWTDDDTDLEWVYLTAMDREGVLLLQAERITQLWREHINRNIWCANQYARQLMDLGIEPPWTGSPALNPWSDFNLSGQFLCESFALLAPAMPQAAARLALHYTRVGIDGGPAQASQLFSAMIATAFVTTNLSALVQAGLDAVDASSELREIVTDVRRWHQQHPADWRATRAAIQKKYNRYGGAMRDKNGYELNAAATVGSLLHGEGDFVNTLTLAFNFGWDCDNNAATAGTILGVLRGNRWLMAQGWSLKDSYRNTTRDHLPASETITAFGDRLIRLADRVLQEQGGEKTMRDGRDFYRLRRQSPVNVYRLVAPVSQTETARSRFAPEIPGGLASTKPQAQARAAYLAIALGLGPRLLETQPEAWAAALSSLTSQFPKVCQVLFHESPTPLGDRLRQQAQSAGLHAPPKQKVW